MCSYRVLNTDSVLAKIITDYWKPQRFAQSFDLFYKGQVPNLALFLLEGTVVCCEGQSDKKILAPALIGASELLQSRESRCSLKILNGSIASVFDRPSLTKSINSNKNLGLLLGTEA